MSALSNPTIVFAKAIESIGGAQAVNAIQSLAGIADCRSQNGPYITELYSARGSKLFFKQTRPERDPFVAIINGTYAWTVDPLTQQIQTLEHSMAAMILGHDFLMLPLLLEQRFTHLAGKGSADFAGTPCEKIKAVDGSGYPCELYFATHTHRLVGMRLSNPIGDDGEQVQIVFAEWHRYEAILLPTKIVITDKSGEFQFVFRQISVNGVDEMLFAIPSGLTPI